MATNKRKAPKRLFKADDRVSRFQHDRSPIGKMKRMAREHEEVLQGIETLIDSNRQEDESMDDAVVALAIHGALTGQPHNDPRADVLVNNLANERTRHDVSDLIWQEALRIVRDSVHRHSELRPGEVGYLSFIDKYIK